MLIKYLSLPLHASTAPPTPDPRIAVRGQSVGIASSMMIPYPVMSLQLQFARSICWAIAGSHSESFVSVASRTALSTEVRDFSSSVSGHCLRVGYPDLDLDSFHSCRIGRKCTEGPPSLSLRSPPRPLRSKDRHPAREATGTCSPISPLLAKRALKGADPNRQSLHFSSPRLCTPRPVGL